jgi:ABC-type phosphate transport system substrate-binding protein
MAELRKTLYCLLLLASSFNVVADSVVVIVNPANVVKRLERHQVVDIYMGRLLTFPDGSSALPMDQLPESDERSEFYHKLVNKSVAQVNAYWARVLFTGRASPPRVIPDSSAVLRTVGNNDHAIGYIAENQVDDTVKVVFRFE